MNKLLNEPRLLGGITDKKYGNTWFAGDRVYDAMCIAVTLTGPIGRTGGYTSLYLIYENSSHKHETKGDSL